MITGKFSITTVAEAKALAKLGLSLACSDDTEVLVYASSGFTTVKNYSNNHVSASRLRADFRVSRVPRFLAHRRRERRLDPPNGG
jgi:hypothetical protein